MATVLNHRTAWNAATSTLTAKFDVTNNGVDITAGSFNVVKYNNVAGVTTVVASKSYNLTPANATLLSGGVGMKDIVFTNDFLRDLFGKDNVVGVQTVFKLENIVLTSATAVTITASATANDPVEFFLNIYSIVYDPIDEMTHIAIIGNGLETSNATTISAYSDKSEYSSVTLSDDDVDAINDLEPGKKFIVKMSGITVGSSVSASFTSNISETSTSDSVLLLTRPTVPELVSSVITHATGVTRITLKQLLNTTAGTGFDTAAATLPLVKLQNLSSKTITTIPVALTALAPAIKGSYFDVTLVVNDKYILFVEYKNSILRSPVLVVPLNPSDRPLAIQVNSVIAPSSATSPTDFTVSGWAPGANEKNQSEYKVVAWLTSSISTAKQFMQDVPVTKTITNGEETYTLGSVAFTNIPFDTWKVYVQASNNHGVGEEIVAVASKAIKSRPANITDLSIENIFDPVTGKMKNMKFTYKAAVMQDDIVPGNVKIIMSTDSTFTTASQPTFVRTLQVSPGGTDTFSIYETAASVTQTGMATAGAIVSGWLNDNNLKDKKLYIKIFTVDSGDANNMSTGVMASQPFVNYQTQLTQTAAASVVQLLRGSETVEKVMLDWAPTTSGLPAPFAGEEVSDTVKYVITNKQNFADAAATTFYSGSKNEVTLSLPAGAISLYLFTTYNGSNVCVSGNRAINGTIYDSASLTAARLFPAPTLGLTSIGVLTANASGIKFTDPITKLICEVTNKTTGKVVQSNGVKRRGFNGIALSGELTGTFTATANQPKLEDKFVFSFASNITAQGNYSAVINAELIGSDGNTYAVESPLSDDQLIDGILDISNTSITAPVAATGSALAIKGSFKCKIDRITSSDGTIIAYLLLSDGSMLTLTDTFSAGIGPSLIKTFEAPEGKTINNVFAFANAGTQSANHYQ